MRIREVGVVHEGVESLPIEVVPPIPVFICHLLPGAVQDAFKKKMVPADIATPPLEPVFPCLAPARRRVDKESVGRRHLRRIGPDLKSEQLVVQFDELALDGVGVGHGRADASKQPSLRLGQEIEFTQHDRTTHLHCVALGHPCHHRGDVPPPLRHSVRVDAAVKQAIVAGQGAGPAVLIRPGVGRPFPLKPCDGSGLARQFLRRQQPSGAGIVQRHAAYRVRVGDRVGAKPLRHHDFHQQILEVVGVPTAREAAPEAVGQPLYLGALGGGGKQPPLEVGVAFSRGRCRHLATHDCRPPELHRRLGEARVGDDLLRQPLHAVVGVRRRLAVETRDAHVAVPGVAYLVFVG